MTHIPLNVFAVFAFGFLNTNPNKSRGVLCCVTSAVLVDAQSAHIEAGLMFALIVPDAKVGRAGGCVYLGRTASVGGAQGHSAGSLCVTDNERPRVWPVTVEVQTRLNLSGSCV